MRNLLRRAPYGQYIPKLPSCFVAFPVLVIILALPLLVFSFDIWFEFYEIWNPFQSRFIITILAALAAMLGIIYAIISECAAHRLYVWFLILGIDLGLFFTFLGLSIVWAIQSSSAHNILACSPTTELVNPDLWTRLDDLYSRTRNLQIAVTVHCGLICIMAFLRSISNLASLLKHQSTLPPPSPSQERQIQDEKNVPELTIGIPQVQVVPPPGVKVDRAHYTSAHPYHPLRLNPVKSTPSIRSVAPMIDIAELSSQV